MSAHHLAHIWRLPRAFAKRPGAVTRFLAQRMIDRPALAAHGLRHPAEAWLIARVREQRLTYLHRRNLMDIAKAVRSLENHGVNGTLIEAGTALGGSAIVLARVKRRERPLRLFDAFGMIPPPTEQDGEDVHQRFQTIVSGQSEGIGGDIYYGYRHDLLSEVTSSLRSFGVDLEREHVELVKGLFKDSLDVTSPVALAHIDADWYDSVTVCLERISPLIVPGGRFIIDDYRNYSGCRRAVDAFLAQPQNSARFQREWHSRLHLVRLPEGPSSP